MEEILALKDLLLRNDIQGALVIAEELEEMSRGEIVRVIRGHAIILLMHLIKQQAENRSTRSWEVSIRNSIVEIQEENKRPKSKGYYLNQEEILEVLEKAYLPAINKASLEVEEGIYETKELERRVNKTRIINQALSLIKT